MWKRICFRRLHSESALTPALDCCLLQRTQKRMKLLSKKEVLSGLMEYIDIEEVRGRGAPLYMSRAPTIPHPQYSPLDDYLSKCEAFFKCGM